MERFTIPFKHPRFDCLVVAFDSETGKSLSEAVSGGEVIRDHLFAKLSRKLSESLREPKRWAIVVDDEMVPMIYSDEATAESDAADVGGHVIELPL